MFDLKIITSYGFLVVCLGSLFLAIASASIGTITVLKGQSLIGDAIGHSAFPGIILAFMIFMSKNPLILLLGGIVSGLIAFILIEVIKKYTKLKLDTILAVILSSFFGLGMLLNSYIQGNPKYSGQSQSGLKTYIFGQASYMMILDVKIILVISIIVLSLLFLFYKEIKLFIFDETYARTIGININFIYGIVMISAMSLIGAGLKIVGAILISSLLIVPAICALQWTNNFFKTILIAQVVGGISAILGTYISSIYKGMSTGPTIIVIMSIFAIISFIFGPKRSY